MFYNTDNAFCMWVVGISNLLCRVVLAPGPCIILQIFQSCSIALKVPRFSTVWATITHSPNVISCLGVAHLQFELHPTIRTYIRCAAQYGFAWYHTVFPISCFCQDKSDL
jgi:hypothetical protein